MTKRLLLILCIAFGQVGCLTVKPHPLDSFIFDYVEQDRKNISSLLFTYYIEHQAWPSIDELDSLDKTRQVKHQGDTRLPDISLKNFKSIEINQVGDIAKINFVLEYFDREINLIEGDLSLTVDMGADTIYGYSASYSKVILDCNIQLTTNHKLTRSEKKKYRKWKHKYL